MVALYGENQDIFVLYVQRPTVASVQVPVAMASGEKTIGKSQKRTIQHKIKPKQRAFRSLHFSGPLHVPIKNSVNYQSPDLRRAHIVYARRVLLRRQVAKSRYLLFPDKRAS